MNEKKNYYNLSYDEDQLEIIIDALEEAENYYNNYLYDEYTNFDELAKIIKELKKLK